MLGAANASVDVFDLERMEVHVVCGERHGAVDGAEDRRGFLEVVVGDGIDDRLCRVVERAKPGEGVGRRGAGEFAGDRRDAPIASAITVAK